MSSVERCECPACRTPRQKQADARRLRLGREESAAKDAYRAGGEVGGVRMSRAAFYNIHPDFRSKQGDPTHPSCLVLGKRGTCLVSVDLIDGDRALRRTVKRRGSQEEGADW